MLHRSDVDMTRLLKCFIVQNLVVLILVNEGHQRMILQLGRIAYYGHMDSVSEAAEIHHLMQFLPVAESSVAAATAAAAKPAEVDLLVTRCCGVASQWAHQ